MIIETREKINKKEQSPQHDTMTPKNEEEASLTGIIVIIGILYIYCCVFRQNQWKTTKRNAGFNRCINAENKYVQLQCDGLKFFSMCMCPL